LSSIHVALSSIHVALPSIHVALSSIHVALSWIHVAHSSIRVALAEGASARTSRGSRGARRFGAAERLIASQLQSFSPDVRGRAGTPRAPESRGKDSQPCVVASSVTTELERARTLAAAQEWTPGRVLAEIGQVDLFDRELVTGLRAHAAALVPGLRTKMARSAGREKLNASLLLLRLGDSEGTRGLVDLLRDPSPDTRRDTLLQLSFAVPDGVAVDRDWLLGALAPMAAATTTPEGGMALDVMLRLVSPDDAPELADLLEHPAPAVRLKVCDWLARAGQDRGAVDALGAMLGAPERCEEDDYWLLQTLETYAASRDAAVARRAAEQAVRYVRSTLDRTDNATANHVWRALDAIALAGHPEETDVLRAMLASGHEAWLRGRALVRLATTAADGAVDRLRAALDDEGLRDAAGEAIASLEDVDDATVDALRAAAGREGRPAVMSRLIGALAAHGADVSDLADATLDPWDRARVHWITHRLGPRDVARRLAAAGLDPADGALAEIDADWSDPPDPFAVVTRLIGEARMTGFDCETCIVPADHARLVRDLARLAEGVFPIESVSQQAGDADRYVVRFVARDRAIRFEARALGDWYDVPAVIGALNVALEQAGLQERYVRLHTGDQTCLVAFVRGEGFVEAAAELRVPIEVDPTTAAR
jgi:hypothetical protein